MQAFHHVYVYYRVSPVKSVALRELVESMQAQLSQDCGLSGRLRRRPEAGPDGEQTWMEVYENLTPELEALLQNAVKRSGIESLISGTRHSERFTDF